MVHDSTRKLQLDKRLLRRRGWISREELEKALAELPDLSEKAELVDPDPEAEPSEPAPDQEP